MGTGMIMLKNRCPILYTYVNDISMDETIEDVEKFIYKCFVYFAQREDLSNQTEKGCIIHG